MPTIKTFVNDVTDFIGTAVANLFLTLAVVVFFWSVINFMMKRAQGASDGMKQARDMLGWSIIGLFVMFSIWGIIYFFQDAFKIQNQNSISAPSIKVNTSNGTAGSAAARNNNSDNSTSQSTSLKKSNGSTCNINSECESGRCEAGRSSTKYCAAQNVNIKLQLGFPCYSSAQCATGLLCRQVPGEARGTLTCN